MPSNPSPEERTIRALAIECVVKATLAPTKPTSREFAEEADRHLDAYAEAVYARAVRDAMAVVEQTPHFWDDERDEGWLIVRDHAITALRTLTPPEPKE